MLTLRVAFRYLFARKTHNAVNVISLISVVGVAVATMAIVCVLSVFNGFTDLASSKLSRLDPQLKITPIIGKTIANADSLASELMAMEGIAVAAPTIEENALAIYDTRQMPVVIKGVTHDYERLTSIRDIVKSDGDFLLTDSVYTFATLSVGAAVNLGAHPGFYQYIGIYTPKRLGRINPANPMTSFRSDSLLVGGVYQVEQAEYDADMVIIPLENARCLLDYTTEASAVEVRLTDDADENEVIKNLSARFGADYKVSNRMQQQENSYRMIEIEKWITFLMLAFILVIASFNVISTLSMLVIEKEADIKTFSALGASRRQISRIFLMEGWLISLAGGVIGIVVGVILCLAQQWGGFIKLGGDHSVMSIDAYPVRVEATDLFVVMALVVVVGGATAMVTSLFTRRFVR